MDLQIIPFGAAIDTLRLAAAIDRWIEGHSMYYVELGGKATWKRKLDRAILAVDDGKLLLITWTLRYGDPQKSKTSASTASFAVFAVLGLG